MSDRWLGIDFSGSDAQWSRGRTRSNVWVAALEDDGARLALTELHRVQQLAPSGDPFANLARLLRAGDFRGAGIDAPFSIPAAYTRGHSHCELLQLVRHLPRGGRRFARASDFVFGVTGRTAPLVPAKPLRDTDRLWAERGVNVRSTLWAGPRGGAPFTSACLTLLAAAEAPAWPFVPPSVGGLVVEGFPAAQLRHWGLPYQRYSGADGRKTRDLIVDALARRADLGEHEAEMRGSPDATDAVLCAFGAIAVVAGALVDPPGTNAATEGWIAVHA